MFVIGSNRKEFENQGVNCIFLHMSAVREMVAPIYKHLFVLTYSHLCFNVGLPPSFSLTEQQYPVCYWSNIMNDQRCRRPYQKPSGHPAVLSSCSLFATSRLFPSSRTTWASPLTHLKIRPGRKVGYPSKKFHPPRKITHAKLFPKRAHDQRKFTHVP